MSTLDQAIQALPEHIQDIILDYVLDDLKFIDIQVQLGWTRKLIIPDDLEKELSRVLKPPQQVPQWEGTTSYKRQLGKYTMYCKQWEFYISGEKRVENRWLTFGFNGTRSYRNWVISKDNASYQEFRLGMFEWSLFEWA